MILQGNIVTETMLGGLTTHPADATFLQCTLCQTLWKWLGNRQSYRN